MANYLQGTKNQQIKKRKSLILKYLFLKRLICCLEMNIKIYLLFFLIFFKENSKIHLIIENLLIQKIKEY